MCPPSPDVPILQYPDLRDERTPASGDAGDFWVQVDYEIARVAPAPVDLFGVDDLLQNLLQHDVFSRWRGEGVVHVKKAFDLGDDAALCLQPPHGFVETGAESGLV